jgi:hypothetical protein
MKYREYQTRKFDKNKTYKTCSKYFFKERYWKIIICAPKQESVIQYELVSMFQNLFYSSSLSLRRNKLERFLLASSFRPAYNVHIKIKVP